MAGLAVLEERAAGAPGAARWLALAAAPVFAIMTVVTAARSDGAAGVICSGGSVGSLIDGMVPMYALMSVVHLAPWIALIVRPGSVNLNWSAAEVGNVESTLP